MRVTAKQLENKIDQCMKQEKKALALSDWNQAEWCRSAARLYRSRLDVAKKNGYWEHEYEPIRKRNKTVKI